MCAMGMIFHSYYINDVICDVFDYEMSYRDSFL